MQALPKNYLYLGALIAAGLVIAVALTFLLPDTYQSDAAQEQRVRAVVADLGVRLKNVSLLSPSAAQDMAREYGKYVAPELLARWQSDPSQAPGRLTSSPWPERIDILSLQKSGKVYIADVSIPLTTSAGDAGREEAVVVLERRGDAWLIGDYTKKQVPAVGPEEIRTRIDQGGSALNIKVVPLEVLEDSRCPSDVQCVWAGTVKVRAMLESPSGTAPQIFELGQPITTETREVELVEVRPASVSGERIEADAYVFIFRITPRSNS